MFSLTQAVFQDSFVLGNYTYKAGKIVLTWIIFVFVEPHFGEDLSDLGGSIPVCIEKLAIAVEEKAATTKDLYLTAVPFHEFLSLRNALNQGMLYFMFNASRNLKFVEKWLPSEFFVERITYAKLHDNVDPLIFASCIHFKQFTEFTNLSSFDLALIFMAYQKSSI